MINKTEKIKGVNRTPIVLVQIFKSMENNNNKPKGLKVAKEDQWA